MTDRVTCSDKCEALLQEKKEKKLSEDLVKKRRTRRQRRAERRRRKRKLFEGEVRKKVVAEVTKAGGLNQRALRKRARYLSERFGESFYTSREWIAVRYEVIKKSKGRCQACGAKASDGITLHVDHIKPRSKFPALELSITNLQVLCDMCNIGKGAWDETDWR